MNTTNFFKFLLAIPLLATICSCGKKESYYISKLQNEGNLILAETYIQSYFDRGWTTGPDRKGVWLTGHYTKFAQVDFREITLDIDPKTNTYTYTLPKIKFDSGYNTDGIRKIYGSVTIGPNFYSKEIEKKHKHAVEQLEKDYIKENGKYSKEIEEELKETAMISAATYLREFTKKITRADVAVYVKFKEN